MGTVVLQPTDEELISRLVERDEDAVESLAPTAQSLMAASQPASATSPFGVAAAVVLLALGAGIVTVLLPDDPAGIGHQAGQQAQTPGGNLPAPADPAAPVGAPGVGGLLTAASSTAGSFRIEHPPAGLNRLLASSPGRPARACARQT